MPKLIIDNLTTSLIPIQDPSGQTALSLRVPASNNLTVSVTDDQLAHIQPILDGLQSASKITYTVSNDPGSEADSLPENVRTGTTTPITAVVGDDVILSHLASPGAVAVSLPTALPKGMVLEIIDDQGDAGSNNITITPVGGTINGGSNYVINANNGAVLLIKTTATDWKAFALANAGGGPTGSAGGDLTGTYPNPTVGANKIGESKLALTVAGVDQVLTGAGALDVTHRTTHLVTTGANALTLVNGTTVGQRKTIIMDTHGGDGTLTPATPSGFATLTFTAVRQWAELEWQAGGWKIVAINGPTVG